jgi:hypothetical protein
MKLGCIAVCAVGCLLGLAGRAPAAVVWLEAEAFADTGGWVNDTQFVDLMGSPYLLAAGTGKPVADAVTKAHLSQAGNYHLWVRCKDWLPPHAPGQFQVLVGGQASGKIYGRADTNLWQWVDGGEFKLAAGDVEVRLHDLTSWWGRCDAVVLAEGDFAPANEAQALAQQREQFGGVTRTVENHEPYDVVVVGGGLSGLGAAVAAARHGCRVALLQDRPLLGGNASDEIQIPVEGDRTGGKFHNYDAGVIEEFYPEIRDYGHADRLEKIVRAEKNIELRLNTRATGVEMKNTNTIAAVLALDVRSGQRLRFAAPVFIDCTGHGWVGYWAGADWRMGEEARSEYNEPDAPEKATTHTMGNDLYAAKFESRAEPVPFTAPAWAYHWGKPEDFEAPQSHQRLKAGRPENFDTLPRGKGRMPKADDPTGGVGHNWPVEFGGMLNTITDAEFIRDELLRINLGLWAYAKNHNPKIMKFNATRELVWLTPIMGVRESRRLMGDYVLTELDNRDGNVHPDTVVYCGWGMDIHHPQGFWVQGNDCMHYFRRHISVPFRSLYSRNIGNLMMAGRCHSATHLGMGATRIERTCCEMGEATGVAAALIKQHGGSPRGIYQSYIGELQQALLKDGCYLLGVKNSDPDDLARACRVSATSAHEGCGAEQVINGWSRAIDDQRNAWVPDLKNAKLPQSIELALPAPAPVNRLHLSFQTRLSRSVDFDVEGCVDGKWLPLAQVRDNEARRRVLAFATVKAEKIRVTFRKVTGQFGVCELRLYNEADR